ncbi:hypothetical protein [Kitasatospora purpeofusca]|uniref:hypothetical protein n=1 Tax=Kitasatospora purpeofusca TaxID=67352 RepID=UPI00364A155C
MGDSGQHGSPSHPGPITRSSAEPNYGTVGTTEYRTSGRRAVALAGAAARREAADTTLRRIAIDLATDAAQAAGADRYAAMRAAHLTQAVLTQDRLTDHVLTALRGGTLDRTQTIAA